MAVNELQFQSELVKSARETGGHAFKLSNRFTSGIPDLYIKLPKFASVFIECKWAKVNPGTRVLSIKLTRPQRKFIEDERAVGGKVLVLVGTKVGNISYAYPLIDVNDLKIDINDFFRNNFTKDIGKPWDLKRIFRSLSPHAF